ncbi:pre-mRNA-processing factor 6-like [Condylostylus longicornis]|uniref:pre-mRNA-processing factor 6-like n=1 Tax=Condylostylus longicornis TaxID=2530218 RepID=UPI00244DF97F|nr:pre-mRNA-processing factor 6-like [Condylostylus longicornis]
MSELFLGRGRGATGFAGGVSRDDATTMEERDRGDYSESNYDEFAGYSEGLFTSGEYDEEDRQADVVYGEIDDKLDARRRAKREQRFKEELSKLRAEKPTLSQQFSDLKRGLNQVSQEEWESIPDIGDYSLKSKQKKARTLAPAPDSLLMNAHSMNQTVGALDARGIGGGAVTPIGFGLQTPLAGFQTPMGLRTPLGLSGLSTPFAMGGGNRTPLGGFRTPMNAGGSATPSLNDLGEARGTILTVKLDKVSTDANIQDIKKARLLLRSVTQTNPQHAPGWIAAARLEELSGKLDAARELIAQGCTLCKNNEDVWLEAARLEKSKEAKSILANGIHENPTSVKLWMEAARKEEDIALKKQILRKALEKVPNSVRLWKEAISLEGPKDAEILLGRAVECVPTSVEMWLALARLSKYENAQRVLNEARKHIPTNIEIWISAAKLEETHNKTDMVDRIISRGVENLTTKGAGRDRDSWMKHAEEAEKTRYPKTCEAIIRATMDIGVESVNRKKIWVSDAEGALGRGMVLAARCLYANALKVLPKEEDLWIALGQLEMNFGTPEALDQILLKSVDREACPHSETLWLMAAKQKWIRGEIELARKLLENGFQSVVQKESIYLAAVKLEREAGETERARKLLAAARLGCRNSEKVWMHSVQLERMLGDYDAAQNLIDEALKLHPKNPKLWMISGQIIMERIEGEEGKTEALKLFEAGRKECVRSIELWLCAVNIYRESGNWNRARALLEEARLKNPKQELLWLAAVEIEIEAAGVSRTDWSQGIVGTANLQMAHHMMSKALQECRKSGILWAEAIFLEPKAAQVRSTERK